jgi:hypothetical protein
VAWVTYGSRVCITAITPYYLPNTTPCLIGFRCMLHTITVMCCAQKLRQCLTACRYQQVELPIARCTARGTALRLGNTWRQAASSGRDVKNMFPNLLDRTQGLWFRRRAKGFDTATCAEASSTPSRDRQLLQPRIAPMTLHIPTHECGSITATNNAW